MEWRLAGMRGWGWRDRARGSRGGSFLRRGGRVRRGGAGGAGRSVQAAEFSLFFSGARRRCAEVAARGGGEIQVAGDQRGDGDLADSNDDSLWGHSAGG